MSDGKIAETTMERNLDSNSETMNSVEAPDVIASGETKAAESEVNAGEAATTKVETEQDRMSDSGPKTDPKKPSVSETSESNPKDTEEREGSVGDTKSSESAESGVPAGAQDEVKPKESKADTKETESGGVDTKPSESAASSVPAQAESEGPKLLDLAFAMDCTGSMGSYINQAQQNIRQIVEDIVAKEQADVQLALVEYRDHPPQDSTFVTRVHDFSSSVREMKGWLDGCSAAGGGDGPEAVADALHQVLKLNWRRRATKICVFISDAPPHGLGMESGDGFPNGCPDGLDPMEIAGKLAEKSITLYLVGCEPSINRYREFFMGLAHVTGGQYIPLGKAQLLTAVISGGAQEELSLQRLMEELNQEVQQELQGVDDGVYSHRELSRKIHSKMASKGHRTQQLQLNASSMPKISTTAESLSYCTNMADIRKKMSAESRMETDGASERRRKSLRKKSKTSARSSMHGEVADADDPAPGARSSGGGWGSMITGAVSSLFGSSKKAESEPPKPKAVGAKPTAEAERAVPLSTSADTYGVVEEALGEEQVYRMVQKSLMQQNLRGKTRGEED